MTSHATTPLPASFTVTPFPPITPAPNKNFDHTPSAFRINEILTTLKQYLEGLGAIVNETNNNYQEFNPRQFEGGGGRALWSTIGFSYAASPGTQLVAMATLLLRGFWAHLRKITKNHQFQHDITF